MVWDGGIHCFFLGERERHPVDNGDFHLPPSISIPHHNGSEYGEDVQNVRKERVVAETRAIPEQICHFPEVFQNERVDRNVLEQVDPPETRCVVGTVGFEIVVDSREKKGETGTQKRSCFAQVENNLL